MTEVLTQIVVAVVTAVGVIAAAWLPQRKVKKKVEEIHTEVKTDHGLSAVQYLELIGEVKRTADEVRRGQDALLALLAEHTASDSRQFAELRRGLASLR